MIYLKEKHIKLIGNRWAENIQIIQDTVNCLESKDFAQPIKPYLRYRNPKNRIIAMPAFVGGTINMSGIKWISSFPDNTKNGISRSHSVIVLNNSDTGVPEGIINSESLSAIRTASVSGFIVKHFIEARDLRNIKLGLIGFGPIGRHHISMFSELFGEICSQICIYDLKKIELGDIKDNLRNKIVIAKNWEQAYRDSDIFITCTVSKDRYIDKQPKRGSLHLNVSLRDYKPEAFEWFKKAIIVDDWEEICRENTDIEKFNLEKGLKKKDVKSIKDLGSVNLMKFYDNKQPIMFNPMGMAVFDIAIAKNYLAIAKTKNIGLV